MFQIIELDCILSYRLSLLSDSPHFGDRWRRPLPIDQAEYAMPRFYFNVHDDGDSLNDDGIELADTRSAGIEALRYAGELIKAKAEQLLGGKPWYMEVTDGGGLLVFRLDFRLTGFPLGAFAL